MRSERAIFFWVLGGTWNAPHPSNCLIGSEALRSSSMAEHKTRVFISHAEVNAEAAEQLAEGLRSESLDVWTYAMIGPGENWAAQVANALEQADAMVVLLTPNRWSPNG